MPRPAPTLFKHASSSGRWLTRQQSDPFVRARAGAQGDTDTLYRSRSSFKLQSLAKKYPCLLPKGGTVIDLGAAPGKHSQETLATNSLTRCCASSQSASKYSRWMVTSSGTQSWTQRSCHRSRPAADSSDQEERYHSARRLFKSFGPGTTGKSHSRTANKNSSVDPVFPPL